ncbi:MAG: hypothetical protein J6386_11185 [Candidatus Synoicihabitans palmerolidicus]|nr:hypothetical protein [Candidatus Synoicihabitans palmerolidicus]
MPVEPTPPIASLEEIGSLGIYHLKRIWSRLRAKRGGLRVEETMADAQFDRMVMDALGIGLAQGLGRLLEYPAEFSEFEQWIRDTIGEPDPAIVARFNAAVRGEAPPALTRAALEVVEAAPDVLSRRIWLTGRSKVM